MAIDKPSYKAAHLQRVKVKHLLPGGSHPIDPGMESAKPSESSLPYGRKGYEQGEGVEVRPGTYDRNAMNPDEEQDYPSGSKLIRDEHLRSTDSTT